MRKIISTNDYNIIHLYDTEGRYPREFKTKIRKLIAEEVDNDLHTIRIIGYEYNFTTMSLEIAIEYTPKEKDIPSSIPTIIIESKARFLHLAKLLNVPTTDRDLQDIYQDVLSLHQQVFIPVIINLLQQLEQERRDWART